MVIAQIGAYLFVWQVPMFLTVLAGWLIAGPYLTRRGLRRAVPEGTKVRLSRCARINLLANGGGLAAMAVGIGFFVALALRFGPRWLALTGVAAGAGAMIGMSWAVHWAMVNLPGRQAFRITLHSAAPMALITLAMLAAAFWPARIARIAAGELARCRTNLPSIDQALRLYEATHPGQRAPSLQALVDDKKLQARQIVCPARPDRPVGYLYVPVPVAEGEEVSQRILVCDRPGNHDGKRNVLYTDRRHATLSEAEFQALLQRPENADLAEADRKDR